MVVAGPESRAIVGLDKTTGKELWRADSDGLGNVWGTQALAKINDERTDVVIDLKKHGRTLEDFFDALTIQERRNEESISLTNFIEELQSEGRVSNEL